MSERAVDEMTIEAAVEFIRNPDLVRTGILRMTRQEVIDRLEMARKVDR